MLTTRQLAFIAAYLADHNGREAAIAAGYSKRTATSAASRLLKHPGVVAEMDKRRHPAAPVDAAESPLDYMLRVMNDKSARGARRDRMAIAAARFQATSGKKQGQIEAAARVSGKFAPQAGPRLVVSNANAKPPKADDDD